ncbi:MAG TPA: hypothetical protein PLN94_04065, partial [Thiolinea sp.]|nr:hypothetical protein [Thiolinea sp.]
MMKGHYLLGECLFAAPDAGALYRARDSTQLQAEVLLQVFPARLLDYPAFRAVQAELGRPVPVGIRYLPVLDSCWEAQEALFVLQAPASWGGKVLPDLQQGPPTSLHAQAAVTSRTLQQQGIIRQPLAEHWFLVAPDGELYLLGTALSTRLLACQPLPVSPVGRQRPAWRSWMTYFAILTSASAVFAAGAGLYPFWRASRPLPDRGPGWALPVDTPQPGSLIQQDRPLPVSAPDKALTTAVVKRLPEAVPKPAELAEAAGMVLPVPA